MHEFQELVYLHRQGERATSVARRLGLAPKTERKYRRRIAAAGLLEGLPTSLPSFDELREAIVRPSERPRQEQSSVRPYHDVISRYVQKGDGPTMIFGHLRREYTDFRGSLSAVKRYCLALKKAAGLSASDVAIPTHTGPGKQAQVDFGYLGLVVDPQTNKLRKCWVFVMVLGHSRMMFAKAVFSQDSATWLRCHQEAFAYFGGVPYTVVPDNLKSAVIKAAFKADESGILNRAYRDQARHFGFTIDPTPAFSPEKKGKVESGVKYVKRHMAPIIRDDNPNLTELNSALRTWLDDTANVRHHGTTGHQPIEVYNTDERPKMKPLVMGPYVMTVWVKAKVGKTAHCRISKRFYSVPWRYIGQDAMVAVTGALVTLYVNDQFAAQHNKDGPTAWSTIASHLPEERRDLSERDPQTWLARAAAIGPDTAALLQQVHASDDVLCQVRRMQSIVRSLESLTKERAESVARHAALFACYEPRDIRSIIHKEVDLKPTETAMVHTAWLQTPAFARQATVYLESGVSYGNA